MALKLKAKLHAHTRAGECNRFDTMSDCCGLCDVHVI